MIYRGPLVTVGTLMLLLAAVSVAAPPTLLTYQGALTDADGNPADGTYSMIFEMHSSATGGIPVWLEVIDGIKVVDGVFTVVLGGTEPLPAGLANCKYLQVDLAYGGGPMLPRQRLTSVPYALEAVNAASSGNALKLGGQSAAYYRNASNLNSGTLPVERLPAGCITSGKIKDGGVATVDLASSAVATAKLADGAVTGAKVLDGSLSTDDLANSAVATAKIADGAVTGAKIAAGSAVSGTVAGAAGFEAANDDSGFGSVGLRGEATAASGQTYGVSGESSSSSGTGVSGEATAASGQTYGVRGEAASADGRGVDGWASSPTGTTYGVRGQAESSSGRGVEGTAGAATGATFGVWGTALSTSGTGVYGTGMASSGSTYGVRGGVNSPDGKALEAYAPSNGYGLYVTSGKAYFAGAVTMNSTLDVSGYATFSGGHGDLAENYRGRDVEAGDVVIIGEDGVLVKCARACDSAVAGIVSTSPSMKLQGRIDEGEGVVPLALVGRVLCKVDASERAIKPGDLLVASATPGHAMKCPSKRPAAGTVIGKALEDLDKGTGVIQVLVTLR
jgi:hypothetical protein